MGRDIRRNVYLEKKKRLFLVCLCRQVVIWET